VSDKYPLRDKDKNDSYRQADQISKQEVSTIKLLTVVTAVTILVALAAAGTIKPKIFATVGALAAPPTVTISVEELRRKVDMHTLPVTEIVSLY
jgi:hypothetical protein